MTHLQTCIKVDSQLSWQKIIPKIPQFICGNIRQKEQKRDKCWMIYYHGDESSNELEVQQVVGVNWWCGVNLQCVVVLACILEQTVHRVEHLVWQVEKPLPVNTHATARQMHLDTFTSPSPPNFQISSPSPLHPRSSHRHPHINPASLHPHPHPILSPQTIKWINTTIVTCVVLLLCCFCFSFFKWKRCIFIYCYDISHCKEILHCNHQKRYSTRSNMA